MYTAKYKTMLQELSVEDLARLAEKDIRVLAFVEDKEVRDAVVKRVAPQRMQRELRNGATVNFCLRPITDEDRIEVKVSEMFDDFDEETLIILVQNDVHNLKYINSASEAVQSAAINAWGETAEQIIHEKYEMTSKIRDLFDGFTEAQLLIEVDKNVNNLEYIDYPSLAVQLFAIKKWRRKARRFLNEISPEAQALLDKC